MSEMEAESSIQTGSKSFAFAGQFFPREKWIAACQIYHWCRYCDDVIDRGENDVSFLRRETNKVLSLHEDSNIPAFNSLAKVFATYNIPRFYADELLKGMEMDTSHTKYKTLKDLELYCYRVASTVGLMMCYIMGISDMKALKHASDLGLAMQLTNICRDVKEDFEMNRNYFPIEWKDRTNFENVEALLDRAEAHYDSGLKGLTYLPLRSAFVIMLAALFYRAIGRKILRTGPQALKQRIVVSKEEKIFLLLAAIICTFMTIPKRLIRKHKDIEIAEVWRPV